MINSESLLYLIKSNQNTSLNNYSNLGNNNAYISEIINQNIEKMKIELVESMNGINNTIINTVKETGQKNDLMGNQFLKNSIETNELIKALNERLIHIKNKNEEIKQTGLNRRIPVEKTVTSNYNILTSDNEEVTVKIKIGIKTGIFEINELNTKQSRVERFERMVEDYENTVHHGAARWFFYFGY